MKHLLVFAAAIILLAFAGVVVWSNRHALTMTHLGFAGGAIALAFALAIPADFKTAAGAVAAYLPVVRGGQPPSGGA